MFCSNCGKEVKNAKFCIYCGSQLSSVKEKKEKQKNNKVKWTIIVVLLILLSALTIIKVIDSGNKEKEAEVLESINTETMPDKTVEETDKQVKKMPLRM